MSNMSIPQNLETVLRLLASAGDEGTHATGALLRCVHCEWVAFAPEDEAAVLQMTADHELECRSAS